MLLPIRSTALWMTMLFATWLQSVQFYIWSAAPSRTSGNCVYSGVNHTPQKRLSEICSFLQQTPAHTSSALSPWGVVSSPVFGEPRSKLFLPSRTFFCFLMLLSAFPLFSRRTGLVNHFFSVLVERLGPGELWMELSDGWGCKLATESDLPPLSLEEAEYASGRKQWGERSYWHLLYFLEHIKRLAVLSMKIQAALMKVFVTYGRCVNFTAHQREEYTRQRAFFTLTHLSSFLPHYLSLWKIADSKVI